MPGPIEFARWEKGLKVVSRLAGSLTILRDRTLGRTPRYTEGVDGMTATHEEAAAPAQGILRRAAQILREEGLLTLWFRILGETVYRRLLLLERTLDKPLPSFRPRGPVETRWLRPEEAAAYASFCGTLSEAEVARRLSEGHRCWIAEAEGRIVHGRWVASSRAWIEYLKLDLPLAPGEAYSYQAYTAPELRGRNLATAAQAAVLGVLKEEGFQRVFLCLQPDRAIAFLPPVKNGFIPVAWLGWVRLGPWRRVFRRPVRRFPSWASRALGTGSRYWDAVSRWRAQQHSHLDWFLGSLKRRTHLRLIRRWGGVPASGRVLKTDLFEEADGSGGFLHALRRAGNTVAGMDLSPAVCERAASNCAAGLCSYAAADARRLPFGDGTFRLVISTSTLDHFTVLEDLGASLRELRRVLGEGGRLIVTVANRQNVFDPLLRLAARLRLTPFFLGRSYTVRELAAEVRLAGFKVLDTTGILHGPRLIPVLSVALARKLGWRWLQRGVRRFWLRAQELEGTRWKHWTASFVAALGEVKQ